MFPPVKNNLGLISLILLRIKEARSEFLSCEYCTSLKKKKKGLLLIFILLEVKMREMFCSQDGMRNMHRISGK